MAGGESPDGLKYRVFRPVALDQPLQWSCSSKGWNCCTNVRIPVRPYDMIRLRHSLASPAHELINSETVTFTWDPAGVLNGLLATEPHPEGTMCTFLEEVTNVDVRRIRDTDPDRFAGLAARVRDAANSDRGGEWRVAALCRVHAGRPEACRGLPFQRDPAREQREHESPAIQMFRCGSCSLAGETTVRQILEGNGLDAYWRADDAWLAATRYAHGRGAAKIDHRDYRRLPLDASALTELWVATYVPDTNERVIERFGYQWRSPLDLDGDRDLYRMMLEEFVERVDTAVEQSGLEPESLGGPGEDWPRPDLERLLDPSRPILPVVAESGAA